MGYYCVVGIALLRVIIIYFIFALCFQANVIMFRLYIMSVPPSFSDLGKAAKDIFSKGFSKYQTVIVGALCDDAVHLFVCLSSPFVFLSPLLHSGSPAV